MLILLVSLLFANTAIGEESERYIALDNKGLWPNLTLLPNGDLVAAVFNQPNHGKSEGDVEVWGSVDEGVTWTLRGTPTKHEPETNRMNVATGVTHNGDLLVLAGGWGGKDFREWKLPIVVSRSADGGRNWVRTFDLNMPDDVGFLIPFGDIVQLRGRTLAASFYGRSPAIKARFPNTHYVLFSEDDGLTWGDGVRISDGDYNETTLHVLNDGRMLAAARTGPGELGARVDLFLSEDEGRTWVEKGPVTLPRHIPADLIQLQDGRVLLSYGIRETGHHGIGVRVSNDGGETWGAPHTVVELEGTSDGGYPSTVQLANGRLVTAYYSNGIEQHSRYHMGVVRWTIPPP
jgi:hypothetical protein